MSFGANKFGFGFLEIGLDTDDILLSLFKAFLEIGLGFLGSWSVLIFFVFLYQYFFTLIKGFTLIWALKIERTSELFHYLSGIFVVFLGFF